MFKVVVSDPKTKKTYQKEISQKESGLLNRKIGDKVKGDFLGMSGYELQITGGSDKQGFPMRPDMQGVIRKKVLLTGGPGFHPKTRGERRRKSVRGNTISPDIVQVNTKILKYGTKKLEQIFGKKEEKPKEEKKEEVKEEKKPEAKPEEKAPKEEKKEEVKAEEKKEPEKPKEEKRPEEKPKEESKPEKKEEKKPEEKAKEGKKK
ncbi:MAG: 30S ribosomal protein S6e [Candidatus Aenigmarchaeota archaeon]|nr:30S ribosomal protein S6e [Candidatus Aenigmarchaeota archaeon]